MFGGGGPLYLVPVSGGDPIPIPGTDGYSQPSWLPDGKTLAALSDVESGSQIELMTPDGHRRATVPIQAYFGVAWSPDGRRLVYAPENGSLTIASRSGKTISTLPPGNSPDWSPDGKRIVFQSRGTGLGQLRIFVVDVDGGNQHQLTLEGGRDGDTSPVWSPDGKRIAFDSDRDGDLEIEVMNSDGSQRRRLTRNSDIDCCPTWSPDGTQLAFVRGADGVIYILNADGTGERMLVGPHPANITKLAWQPVAH